MELPEIKIEDGFTTLEARVALRLGLCARPSMALVEECNNYSGNIFLERKDDGRKVDGKSVMQTMILAAGYETDLKIYVEGTNEVARRQALRLYSGITTQGDIDTDFNSYELREGS